MCQKVVPFMGHSIVMVCIIPLKVVPEGACGRCNPLEGISRLLCIEMYKNTSYIFANTSILLYVLRWQVGATALPTP